MEIRLKSKDIQITNTVTVPYGRQGKSLLVAHMVAAKYCDMLPKLALGTLITHTEAGAVACRGREFL